MTSNWFTPRGWLSAILAESYIIVLEKYSTCLIKVPYKLSLHHIRSKIVYSRLPSNYLMITASFGAVQWFIDMLYIFVMRNHVSELCVRSGWKLCMITLSIMLNSMDPAEMNVKIEMVSTWPSSKGKLKQFSISHTTVCLSSWIRSKVKKIRK